VQSRLHDNSARSALVEKIQAILREKGLTLYRVSQESAKLYGRSSPHFLPHNLYYDLRNGTFSPSLHQIWALGRISGYRVADWLRVFGFDLENICRQQVRLPSPRTFVLDTSQMDPSEWVPWFRIQNEERGIPRIAPLTSMLKRVPPRRVGSIASGDQHFLYARIGSEDAFAFPELIPGSIVRVDPDISELRCLEDTRISGRIFLIEHSKGFCCCRVRLSNGVIVPIDNTQRYAQVALKLPDEAALRGIVDFEFRPLLRNDEPRIAKDLARNWKPHALSVERNFGQMLKRARRSRRLSFRKAASLSRLIAQDLGDQRYTASSSSLSEYEIRNSPPRDVHKKLRCAQFTGCNCRR
jgi:hypothetical protein